MSTDPQHEDNIFNKAIGRRPRHTYLVHKYHLHLHKDLPRLKRRRGVLVNHVSSMRLTRHITQSVLADMTGVSRRTINSIETSGTEPRISVALALSKALEVPVEELFRID